MGDLNQMNLYYPSNDQIAAGYAHSIADMNDDFIPDLIICAKSPTGKVQFQISTINQSNQYQFLEIYPVPDDSFYYGQSLFADFGNFILLKMKICGISGFEKS